jgi:4-hydroxybenzoate polyprenyltransferase
MSVTTIQPSPSVAAKFSLFARDIKISHTVFALPWAVFATFLAARGWPGWGKLGLIAVCMVTARTVAMAANRLLDAKLDAVNPRTARRAIPSGALAAKFVAMILLACAIVFIAATLGFWVWYRNPWPAILCGPVLGFLCGYPFMKRFTRLCHYYLGAALALAPVCAWIAIAGSLAIEPLLMAAAVLLWTAGFDIIYACQDYESDVQHGVFSVPAKVGIARALWIARFTHVACVAMLIALGKTSPLLGPIYFTGVGIAIALLLIEHSLVKANDLSKVGLAFFTLNGIISVVIGTLGIIDVFW